MSHEKTLARHLIWHMDEMDPRWRLTKIQNIRSET